MKPRSKPLPIAWLGSCGLRHGIWRGLADLPERVAIGVVERLRLTRDDQNRVLLVGPSSVGMDRNSDGITYSPERVL